MNFNSGAKKGYYFVPVKDSSPIIFENVKIAFPANPRKKFKFFKTRYDELRDRTLDLKDLF
jgi:hypothetical protein